MSHTPGPWVVADSINAATVHCKVTEVIVADCRNLALDRGVPAANARLIAAAPDLLEALEEVLGWETLCPLEVYEQARAAIRKARGEV
jgi:hypothetical protein